MSKSIFGNKDGQGFFRSMLINSGGNQDTLNVAPENTVAMYISELRDMAVRRYIWESDDIMMSNSELLTIEEILCRRGWAVLLRPKVRLNGQLITLPIYRVFEANARFYNNRTMMPDRINILNINNHENSGIDGLDTSIQYEKNEFVTLTDFRNCNFTNVPFLIRIRDFALRLWELDKMIMLQGRKWQLPILGRTQDETAHNNLKMVAEATSNNALFAYMDNRSVGDHDQIFTEFKPEYILDKLYMEKAAVFEEFYRLIGISTASTDNVTYVASDVQRAELGIQKFKRELGLFNRQRGIDEAKEKFGLILTCRTLLDYDMMTGETADLQDNTPTTRGGVDYD